MLYFFFRSGGNNGDPGSPLVLLLLLAVGISTAAYILRKIIQSRKTKNGGAFPAIRSDAPADLSSPPMGASDSQKYICRQCGYVAFEEITCCPDCGCCDIAAFSPGAKPEYMHLFCPRCGTLVRCTDRFCFRCGTEIQ